ncbi:unnamed protein product [Trichobilharzia szidati]|nr:unnamed protein product [Trichobilharzia szidati]
MSSNNNNRSTIPGGAGSNGSRQSLPPTFLVVGTAVSAKYRGAFCEALVDHVELRFRLRVQLKSNKSIVFADETSLVSGSPVAGSEVVVQIPNSSPIQNEVGVVMRVTDTSSYSVVFDDGDRRTLRRTQLVLKGERHFKESESLDSLPLTNPEQFRQPVIDQRRKHRSGEESNTVDANVAETKKENVTVKNDTKVSNQNVSDHNIKPEKPTEDNDKNISLNVKKEDVNCSAITEISVGEEKAELCQPKAESTSDVVATDIKQLPTGYCRLLGRLVIVDMPLTAKDCIGSPTHGSSTPVVKSPSLSSRRRFTPAIVVLPSAMPSIDLGNISTSIGSDGVGEDDVKTPSYKLLVRSFKDNKFFAVSVAFVRRLKRSEAVEIAHSHPSLRSAFERALLWLDRFELPTSWGEDAIELMLGTKDWRSLKRRCKLAAGSEISDSTILSPPNLKHSRVSSPSSSEASPTANNCRENFQKSSGTLSVNKSEKAARKRPRLSDKTQSSRSSCRLKVKRLKTQILRSDTTGDNQSDASSNELSKLSTAKHESVKENMTSQKSDTKTVTAYDGDSSDSASSDEASSNSVESDSDARSLSSLASSSTNKSSSSVSSTISSSSSSSSISSTTSCSTGSSSSSSSSSTNNSTSSSVNSSSSSSSCSISSTTASCASPDSSSTSSVAGFEARDRWIAQLYRFMDERGTPINKAPSLANKDLDLYRLYQLVQKLGGFLRVTSQLKWGYVYSKMDLPQNFSAGPRNLQAAFKKYLYPWDDITKKLGTNLCELPSSRPRYASSVQNASPVVQVTGLTSAPTTNSSASVSTSASTNGAKVQLVSSREKQSQDSGNLEVDVKAGILDSAEITQASSTEESKTTAVTNTTSTTTTTAPSKTRASDKNCALDQQLAPYLKGVDDEYTCQATPLRKSNLSDDKLSKTASATDGADRPISSASSNSSSKSAFRKRSYDSTMTDIPLINFGRECTGAMGDLSNRIIPVRSRVRVRCGDHVAYEAKVLKHIRPQPSICSRKTASAGEPSPIPTSAAAAVWAGVGDIQYRVHYMGWNTRHDEVVPRSRIISVIEWGRGVDEGRPPSCSSLSPIVHEPRKGNTIKIRNESLSKDICTKLSSSTGIKVDEKESADKEAVDESTLEDDNEHEDDDSNQSQTTETASDNITTTAPIIRRRRLMFSSHKPGRQISSRKSSSLSKRRNESCSQRLSKLPLLSRFHLPKTHPHVNKTNISEENKQLNKDSVVKKAKTTSRDRKTDRKSVKKHEPVKRSQSNLSLNSDISGTSSSTPSSKTQIQSKKLKIENLLDESTNQKSYSISEFIPTVEIKRLVADALSTTDSERRSVDNHQSTNNELQTKAATTTSQRKVVNKKSPRKAFTSSESSSKLSPTLKSKLMSVSSTFTAKKLVSKLTKPKAVHKDSKISPRKVIKQEERMSSRNLFEDCFNKLNITRTLPSTMSKSIQLKENNKLSVVIDNLSSSCAPLSSQTTAMTSTTTTPVVIPSFASSSSSSSGSFVTTRNEDVDKYSLLRESRSEESSIKQSLFKKKETKTTSHPTKKLTTTTTTTTTSITTIVTTAGISAAISTTAPTTITSNSTPAVVTSTTTTATTIYDVLRSVGLERKVTQSDFTSSTGANLKLVISRINEKSKSKIKSKKLSKSTDENYPGNKSNNQYVHPSPYIEDISDGDSSSSSSDNDELESVSKSSRSRLRSSARNSTNSSTTSSHKKREHPIKQSTATMSDISSASSNIDSEHEDNNNNNLTSEYLHNEIIDSSSESVYGTNDALPRLTRSQHRQLLGDTPPGSTLQTAAPTPSNRSASTTHASKSSKHKSTQLKEQSDEIENASEVSPSITTTEMEDLPILSQMQQPQVDLSDSEVIGKLDAMPTQKNVNDENDTESVSENCECIDLEKMDISLKEESVESPTNHSIPNLSPKVLYDDTEDIDVGINQYQSESIISEPTIVLDKQVEVLREEEDVEKILGDNDTEDDRSSVETMSTDPMDGMLYDLTMSSVKSHQELSSNEDEELGEVPHSVHSSDQPVDIIATVDTVPDKETQPINEVVEVKETNETVENKPTIEPVTDEQRDKITEIEQINIPKSRSRVRRSSSNSNSTDTTSRRGKRRNRSSSHRVMISENSSALNTNSPHYPPISPHPASGTIVSAPVPSGSKAATSQSNNRPTLGLRRFGGPFLPVPGLNDLSSDMKCHVLQERMRQILGAWRQAKQCLKDLDHRCSRSRRLKARKPTKLSISGQWNSN